MNDLAALEARYCESVLNWALCTANDLLHCPKREQEAHVQVKKAWEDWKAEHRRIHGA